MIKLVLIKNPFNIHERDIKNIEYSAVKTLKGYLAEAGSFDTEIKVAVNSVVIEKEEWGKTSVADNAYIVICPVIAGGNGGAKQIIGIVAMIALSVVAMGPAAHSQVQRQ